MSHLLISENLRASAQELGLNFSKEESFEYDSPEGAALVEKYNITVVPTVIVSKEAGSSKDFPVIWDQIGSVESDGSFVLRLMVPPYRDLELGNVVGLVGVIELTDSKCERCFNVSIVTSQLSALGVYVSTVESIEADSAEGEALIQVFNITKIPTVIISPDFLAYRSAVPFFEGAGTFDENGVFVLREPVPPFKDLQENRLVGVVQLIQLNDSSCAECYDVRLHSVFLASVPVAIENTTTFDVSSPEGMELVEKYNVSKVPTVIVSHDIAEYEPVLADYMGFGTFEDDGWFVVRDLNGLEVPLKDLSTNETVSG